MNSDEPNKSSTIFLFEEKTLHAVIPRYGDLLLQTFDDEELALGTFSAVGQVHNPPSSYKPDQWPKYVGDYWKNYDPELASRDSRPSFFISYVTDAQRQICEIPESSFGVNKFADALIRVIQLSDSGKNIGPRRYPHRFICDRLQNPELLEQYLHILTTYVIDRSELTQELWDKEIKPVVLQIAGELGESPISGKAADEFLQWAITSEPHSEAQTSTLPADNHYLHSANCREVRIRVGSIHSVKGETHTATLVLETFWNEHNIASILPWLTGDRSGGNDVGKRDSLRLRVHYVAMTRPTHLLCLAMRRDTVCGASGELNQEVLTKLRAKGWNIVFL